MLSGLMRVCRAAKEKDHLAGQHEREAGKLGDLHARKQQGLSPLEAEMENLRRCCLWLTITEWPHVLRLTLWLQHPSVYLLLTFGCWQPSPK